MNPGFIDHAKSFGTALSFAFVMLAGVATNAYGQKGPKPVPGKKIESVSGGGEATKSPACDTNQLARQRVARNQAATKPCPQKNAEAAKRAKNPPNANRKNARRRSGN